MKSCSRMQWDRMAQGDMDPRLVLIKVLATYGEGRWTRTRTQSLFQSPKTTGCQQRHVKKIVQVYPGTLFHVLGCDGADGKAWVQNSINPQVICHTIWCNNGSSRHPFVKNPRGQRYPSHGDNHPHSTRV